MSSEGVIGPSCKIGWRAVEHVVYGHVVGEVMCHERGGADAHSCQQHAGGAVAPVAPVADEASSRPQSRGARRRLPKRRAKETFELRIGGRKLFVEVGLYEDGTPGEVFLSMSKPGSDLMHFVNGFAIAISLLLQYGASLSDVVHSFGSLSGGPSGDVLDHDTIRSARSIIDLVAKLLQEEYGAKQNA